MNYFCKQSVGIYRYYNTLEPVQTSVDVHLLVFAPGRESHPFLDFLVAQYPGLPLLYQGMDSVLLHCVRTEAGDSFTLIRKGPDGISAVRCDSVAGSMGDAETPPDVDVIEDPLFTVRRVQFHAVVFRLNDHHSVLRENLSEDMRKEFDAGTAPLVQSFLDALDRDIIDAIWPLRCENFYNWILKNKARRLQAVQVYPRFAHVYKLLDEVTDNELTRVVDEGRRLEDFLCKAFRIKKATFRRINLMPEDDFNLVFRQGGELDSIKMRLDEVYRPELIPETPSVSKVTLVDAFPPDLFPKEQECKWFSRLAFDSAPINNKDNLSGYIKVMEKSYRNAVGLMRRGTLEEYDLAAMNHGGAIEHMARKLLIPAAVATGGTRPGCFLERRDGWYRPTAFDEVRERARAVMIRRNIFDAYRFTMQWYKHDISNRVMTGFDQPDIAELRLPCVMRDPWESKEGYRFEPLVLFKHIAAEGKEMRHCLSSLSHSHVRGKIFTFRVFGPEGFRATAAVKYDDRQKAYSLSEIQFYNNGQFGGGQTTRIEAPEHVGMMIVDHLNALKVEPEFFPETVKAVTDGIVDGTPELADPQVAREVADTNFPLFMLALPSHLRAPSPTELIMGPFCEVIEPYMVSWS